MIIQVKDVNNPFPHGLALVRLLDGDRAGKRGCAAMLAFNRMFQLIYIKFRHSPT